MIGARASRALGTTISTRSRVTTVVARQLISTTSSSSPSTAAIVPGRAVPPCSISSPRRRTVRTASANDMDPAAW